MACKQRLRAELDARKRRRSLQREETPNPPPTLLAVAFDSQPTIASVAGIDDSRPKPLPYGHNWLPTLCNCLRGRNRRFTAETPTLWLQSTANLRLPSWPESTIHGWKHSLFLSFKPLHTSPSQPERIRKGFLSSFKPNQKAKDSNTKVVIGYCSTLTQRSLWAIVEARSLFGR